MENWLKDRLSPVKADTASWQELAETIEQFWEENFDPEFSKAVNLRSVYTADAEGIAKIIHELGSYYEDDLATDNIPISVAQRKYELCIKGAVDPFDYTLRRLDIDAYWSQLYAKKADDYGTAFFLDYELDPEQEYFLTSRGQVCVDLTFMTGIAEKIAVLRRRINHLKPLHIFFYGFHYFINVVLPVEIQAVSDLYMNKDCWPIRSYPALVLDGTWNLDGSEVLEYKRIQTEVQITEV